MKQAKVRISSLSSPESSLLGSSILEVKEGKAAWQVLRQAGRGKGMLFSLDVKPG